MKKVKVFFILVLPIYIVSCASLEFMVDALCLADPECAASEHSYYNRQLKEAGYEPITSSQSTPTSSSNTSRSRHPCQGWRDGHHWFRWTCSAPGKTTSNNAQCISSFHEESKLIERSEINLSYTGDNWRCTKDHAGSIPWQN